MITRVRTEPATRNEHFWGFMAGATVAIGVMGTGLWLAAEITKRKTLTLRR